MPLETPRIGTRATSCRLAAGTRIAIPTAVAEAATRRVQDLQPADLIFAGMPGAFIATPILGISEPPAAPPAPPSASITTGIIRLRAGAVAPGQPQHELVLPLDALLLVADTRGADAPMVVPIAALANGVSIVRDTTVQPPPWYDITMDGTTILLVDGIGLATSVSPVTALAPIAPSAQPPLRKHAGNRSTPRPRPSATGAHPRPLRRMLPGPAVLALRRRLYDRARDDGGEPAPPSATPSISGNAGFDPVNPVRLFANETEIPRNPDGDTSLISFLLPPGSGPVRLASASALSPQPDDSRQLGVCVTEIDLDGIPLDLASPAPGPGFHPLEQAGQTRWRWTNGDAWLVLPQRLIPQTLTLHLNDWHLHLHSAAA